MKHRKIKNVMSTDVATARETTPFKDIVRLLDQRDVSAVPRVLGGFLRALLGQQVQCSTRTIV